MGHAWAFCNALGLPLVVTLRRCYTLGMDYEVRKMNGLSDGTELQYLNMELQDDGAVGLTFC